MYSTEEIYRLQFDDEFFFEEGDKYCLVSMFGKEFQKRDLVNQANFCVLQILSAYKDNKIDKNTANHLINKVDALEYSEDMLGPERCIKKLNKEIIEDSLNIPFFNSLGVLCEDLYDYY